MFTAAVSHVLMFQDELEASNVTLGLPWAHPEQPKLF